MNAVPFLIICGVGLLFASLVLTPFPSRHGSESAWPAWITFAGAVLCIATAVSLVHRP